MKIPVTGTVGFVGSHVAMHLLERGGEVIGPQPQRLFVVPESSAHASALADAVCYAPQASVEKAIAHLVDGYCDYGVTL